MKKDTHPFFVASKSDSIPTNFASHCKDILLTKPCNLHELYSCADKTTMKLFMIS